MPGDLRCEEFGPYPYRYEGRYDHHPDAESQNVGLVEEFKKENMNDQVQRVFRNLRQKYIDSDLNL
jgi:hypothetical protein